MSILPLKWTLVWMLTLSNFHFCKVITTPCFARISLTGAPTLKVGVPVRYLSWCSPWICQCRVFNQAALIAGFWLSTPMLYASFNETRTFMTFHSRFFQQRNVNTECKTDTHNFPKLKLYLINREVGWNPNPGLIQIVCSLDIDPPFQIHS